MVTRLERRTVCFVGGGFTAALAARQLTAKGVDVLVLERGTDRTHGAATSLPSQRDPFNAGYNPKGPLGALALKLGDGLNDYVARPRHL